MGFLTKLQKFFEYQINTGSIDPEIPVLLSGYQYSGLTKPDDETGLALGKTYFDYPENKYVNCYRFFAQEDEFILIDRKYSGHSRTVQGNAVAILGVPVKHDFEFTDDGSNLFSPDIKRAAKHGKLDIYFDPKEDYQRLESHFQGIIDHYEQFKNACGPMSFFSNPGLKIVGYYENGGLFGKEELDSIVRVMRDIKHKGVDL
jgi:hypothetical protein